MRQLRKAKSSETLFQPLLDRACCRLLGHSPHDLTVESTKLLLQSKYNEIKNSGEHTPNSQLLRFCLKKYFTFEETMYEQVEGTPMGSLISGLIFGMIMQRLESLVFQHQRQKFWAQYVDDTFVVVKRDEMLACSGHLNVAVPGIQFTMEGENK
ncbi:hypothetical protein SprV_0301229000 [Sparganum proliferum]